MFRWTILCGCAIALIVVAGLTVRRASSVETQLSVVVAERLAAGQIGASSVDANGRDVVVSGVASGEHERVHDLVGRLAGVRSVELDDGTATELDSSSTDVPAAAGPDAVNTPPTFIEQRSSAAVTTAAGLGLDPTVAPLVIADVAPGAVYLRGSVARRADRGLLGDLSLAKATTVRILVMPGRPGPSPELLGVFADIVRTVADDLETGQVRLFGTAIEVRGRALPNVDPSDLRFSVGFIAAGRVEVVVDVDPAS